MTYISKIVLILKTFANESKKGENCITKLAPIYIDWKLSFASPLIPWTCKSNHFLLKYFQDSAELFQINLNYSHLLNNLPILSSNITYFR